MPAMTTAIALIFGPSEKIPQQVYFTRRERGIGNRFDHERPRKVSALHTVARAFFDRQPSQHGWFDRPIAITQIQISSVGEQDHKV